jgi:hypothetical protein
MISLLPSNLSGDCGTSLHLEKKTDFFKFQANFKVTVSHNKSQWLQERTLNFARIWTPIYACRVHSHLLTINTLLK